MPARRPYVVLREITSPHESRPDRHYQIREGADGAVYCTCPGWRFRRTCRHLTEYLEYRTSPSSFGETWDDSNNRVQSAIQSARTRAEARLRQQLSDSWNGPASVGSAPVFMQRPKYWNVYEGGVLVGKVTGESKSAVLAMFKKSSGASLPIAVEELN